MKMIWRMGKNLLLRVLLVAVVASQLCSCHSDEVSNQPVPDGLSLSGQVTSGSSGLAGVIITLSGSDQGIATSDAAGNYVFSGLGNGSYTLTPSLNGYIFTPSSRAQTISNANIGGVNFIATPSTLPTFTLSGTVTSAGNSLSGVIMTLSGAGSATATINAVGNYLFGGLVNGSYTVTPAAPGFTFNPINSALLISNANITGINFSAVPAVPVMPVICPASGATNVTIQDFSFTLSAITIDVNSVVKWTNTASSIHTVTSTSYPNLDGMLNSGPMGNGESVCYQFLVAGTYPYFCTFHPSMIGSVVVQ